MEDKAALPGRSEIGSKIFSPFVDRISLLSLSLAGLFFAPGIVSILEPDLGRIAFPLVACSLIICIPLVASSIGKIYVRIRA